jgi:hypothetical protein
VAEVSSFASVGGRWSKARARQRCEPLSRIIWVALPSGLAVFTVVNAVQLGLGWPGYRHPWIAVALLLWLAATFLLVWYRSPTGVGPVLSAIALLTGPAACLIMGTQLSEAAVAGPANWVAGFCVVPIAALPLSRPAEEMLLGVAGLAAAQAYVMADAGRTLRDLFAIVMSGGAGPIIGVAILLYVAVVRQMDTIHREQARRALQAVWSRIYFQDAVVSLQDKVTETQATAARVLDAVADGTADLSDPGLQRTCAALTADLRRELRNLGQPSLLLTEIMPHDGGLRWNVTDEYNASQHFAYQDRLALVKALRSVLPLAPEGVSVSVLPLPENALAKVVVVSGPDAIPPTAQWQDACRRFAVRAPATPPPGGRWIYSWNMAVTSLFWRRDDHGCDR